MSVFLLNSYSTILKDVLHRADKNTHSKVQEQHNMTPRTQCRTAHWEQRVIIVPLDLAQ